MANEEHVAILKKGVEVWNQWRLENETLTPDLHRANLAGADLSRANLFSTNFSGANLRRAKLGGANLSEANLRGADVIEANLFEVNFSAADLNGTNLSGADLVRAYLSRADLSEASLNEANLSGANLSGADLSGANLSGANLSATIFIRAKLIAANLNRARLERANFKEADLSYADLSETNLIDAVLSEADLSSANLSAANLRGANLRGADLSATNLSEAVLGFTTIGNVDLRTVKGLELVQHIGPSTIGIDTIYRSAGKISEVFLRGAGIPDIFIDYMKSLTGEAIKFHSCFISHSSKDQEFVEQLYTDLQNKGVRCWYAPEDLKIGEPFVLGIEQGISLHDKLLLVLSGNSVSSGWVQHEVFSAMGKEQGKAPWVLFPICLDDAIMNTGVPWATMVRQSRHIGDFTNWKNHDSYRKAFDRLLRDLKEGE